MTSKRPISLRKARKILQHGYMLWRRRQKAIAEEASNQAKQLLVELQLAIALKDREKASLLAEKVQQQLPLLCPEPSWRSWSRSVIGWAVAILIVLTVQGMWLEQYVIPTGSMRPTFKEQDRLLVTKTAFGINRPLMHGHIWFDNALLEPGEIIVFNTLNIPGQDYWDRLWGVLPVRKQLVKRCMGLPGDTIYFYGGQIYAIDKDGEPKTAYRTAPWVKNLEYVPYIRPEGQLVAEKRSCINLVQWAQPVARWRRGSQGWVPQLHSKDSWVMDVPLSRITAYPAQGPRSYADLWGIRHYALCRLKPVKNGKQQWSEPVMAYLEVHHSPEMRRPEQSGIDQPGIVMEEALIPVGRQQWQALREALYTARFVVQDQHAYRYTHTTSRHTPNQYTPRLAGVPDGTYEFYNGKAVSVGFGGMTTPLPPDHPLYSDELFPTLFNLGIEFHKGFENRALPSRYAYFRMGDLFVMGHPIYSCNDPLLREFMEQQSQSTKIPFRDWGPPTAEQIRLFGYQIPDEHCVALGDNHAMSGDTREFGPVPVANLGGSPSLIFWPPSRGDDCRIGGLDQPKRPWLTLPNIIVSGSFIALIVAFEVWLIRRSRVRF